MSTQLTFLEPGAYNTLQVKLTARNTDPATSVRAAKARQADGKSLALFLAMLGTRECTVREVAQHTINPDFWFVEWNKRVKAWDVAGHIELTGAERGGGRVWRVRR